MPDPSALPDPLPLTDAAEALRRAGDRPEVARELFGLLRDTLGDAESELREALRAGDVARLRDAAHRLHGASLYCGVPRLHERAAEVERLCGRHDAPSGNAGLGELSLAMSRLLETIAATRAAADPLRPPTRF